MTLQQFEDGLKAACPGMVYEIAAPKNVTRYAAWHKYGRSSIFGDNHNQIDAPRVQIDIVTNVRDDSLADDVTAALWTMNLPYTVVSEGYDDNFFAYRTILQLVVT